MLAFEMNYVRLIGCCDVTRKLDNVRKMREREVNSLPAIAHI